MYNSSGRSVQFGAVRVFNSRGQCVQFDAAYAALISARQWLSVLRSGGSKKTRFAVMSIIAR